MIFKHEGRKEREGEDASIQKWRRTKSLMATSENSF
jgi:hypothetical protein